MKMNETLETPTLDLQKEVSLFRKALPLTASTPAWVNETALEYRRFLILKERGGTEVPQKDSLLALFLQYFPEQPLSRDTVNGTAKYEELFGSVTPYNWKMTLSELMSKNGGGTPPSST